MGPTKYSVDPQKLGGMSGDDYYAGKAKRHAGTFAASWITLSLALLITICVSAIRLFL